jgi:hypothetical protein
LLPARAALPSPAVFLQRPAHAAELLALAAVARHGLAAGSAIAGLRATYPDATPAGLTRIATQRLVRQARNSGVVSGLAGTFAVLADTVGLYSRQAELVLQIAAAHGHDPQVPDRAADLLVLLGVHADLPAARQALVDATNDDGDDSPVRLTRPAGRALAAGAVRLGVKRLFRFVPGIGALVGAVTNVRLTQELAVRAARYYEKKGGPTRR